MLTHLLHINLICDNVNLGKPSCPQHTRQSVPSDHKVQDLPPLSARFLTSRELPSPPTCASGQAFKFSSDRKGLNRIDETRLVFAAEPKIKWHLLTSWARVENQPSRELTAANWTDAPDLLFQESFDSRRRKAKAH